MFLFGSRLFFITITARLHNICKFWALLFVFFRLRGSSDVPCRSNSIMRAMTNTSIYHTISISNFSSRICYTRQGLSFVARINSIRGCRYENELREISTRVFEMCIWNLFLICNLHFTWCVCSWIDGAEVRSLYFCVLPLVASEDQTLSQDAYTLPLLYISGLNLFSCRMALSPSAIAWSREESSLSLEGCG